MKRPLACLGFSYLLGCIAAALLPVAFLPLAGILLAAICVILLIIHNKFKHNVGKLLIVGISLFLSFSHIFLFTTFKTQPIESLEGRTLNCHVQVLEIEHNEDDNFDLNAKILHINESKAKNFTINITTGFEPELGDVLELPLYFYLQEGNYSSLGRKSSNNFISAAPAGEIKLLSNSQNIFTLSRKLQYKMSANIKNRIPGNQGFISCAISIGDKRFLSYDIKNNFRQSGISHILVVSGLHLAILCNLFYNTLLTLTKKQKISSILTIGFILFFIFVTGMSASIIRSGIVYILLYVGGLFNRKSDTLTSLGFAAIILCAINPYAALNMGLLLSFSSTLGIICSNYLFNKKLKKRISNLKFKKILHPLIHSALSSLLITFTTLPILIAFNSGISVLTVFMNILLLPLSSFLIISGLLCALPNLAIINQLVMLFAILNNNIIFVLDKLTAYLAQSGHFYLYVGGFYGLITCLAVYFLLFTGIMLKQKLKYSISAVLILCLSLSLHHYFGQDIITVTTAGSATNSPVILSYRGDSIVFYRGRVNPYVIEDVFWKNNIGNCILFIDMRLNSDSTEYVNAINYDKLLLLNQQNESSKKIAVNSNINVYIKKQNKGNLAIIDIAGYTIAIPCGYINMEYYGYFNSVYGGSSKISGMECDNFIYNRKLPENIEHDNYRYNNLYKYATIKIRPEKSAIIVNQR